MLTRAEKDSEIARDGQIIVVTCEILAKICASTLRPAALREYKKGEKRETMAILRCTNSGPNSSMEQPCSQRLYSVLC